MDDLSPGFKINSKRFVNQIEIKVDTELIRKKDAKSACRAKSSLLMRSQQIASS